VIGDASEDVAQINLGIEVVDLQLPRIVNIAAARLSPESGLKEEVLSGIVGICSRPSVV
jgi:hypothetical protein